MNRLHVLSPQEVDTIFSDARAKLLEGQLEQQRRALQKKEEVDSFNISS
jgi:hypothetical protein